MVDVKLDESLEQAPNTVTIHGDGDHPYISYDLRLIDLELRTQRACNEHFFPRPKTADDLLNNLYLDYLAGYLDWYDLNLMRSLVPKAMEKYTKKAKKRR